MKSIKIDKLNIFGVQPSTVNEVPDYIDDLIDGNRVTALENNKQDTLSQTQMDAVNSGINSNLVSQIGTNTSDISNLENNKQDKLIAGTNITIDANNKISASGSSLPKQLLNGVYAGSSTGVGDVSLNFHTNTSTVDIKTHGGTIEASYTQSGDNLTFDMSGTTIGTGVINSSFEIVADMGSEITLTYIGSVNTAIVDNNVVQNNLTLGTGLSIVNGALTASGGSVNIYQHQLSINNFSGDNFYVELQFYSNDPSTINSTNISSLLNKSFMATGYYSSSNIYHIITSVEFFYTGSYNAININAVDVVNNQLQAFTRDLSELDYNDSVNSIVLGN